MVEFHGRVLVLGANGETGKLVMAQLQAYQIPARALVRSVEKAQGLANSTTEVVIGEVNHVDSLQQAIEGTSAIISTIGTRTFTDVKMIEDAEYITMRNIIDAARRASIQQVVICSSMGTDNPNRIPPLALVLRVKQRAEQALIESGLTYTIVHPGGLCNEPGGKGVLVHRHPLTKNGLIARADVAEVLIQALLQPEAKNVSVDIINQPQQQPARREGLFRLDP